MRNSLFRRSRRDGMSLVGVLMAAAAMGILATAMISMFKWQTDAARQLAGRSGVTDLSTGMSAFFSGAQCATTGTFLLNNVPATVSVTGTTYSLALDTVLFSTGTPVISSLNPPEMKLLLNPYTVSTLTFEPVGVPTATTLGAMYPFKMDVTFASAKGAPPRPIVKFLNVFTDPSKKVVGACFANVGGATNLGPGPCYFEAWGGGVACQPGYVNKGTSGFILDTPSCPYFGGVPNGAQLGPGLPWWWCHAQLCCTP